MDKRVIGANRFGIFWASTKLGKISSISDFEGDKFPNEMNKKAIPNIISNESRVLYPMVRKSYLKAKGPSNPQLRGQDEFVQVSWDVALDLTAKALKENFDKYGAQSIYGECYWWGGSGKISWGRTTAHRMLNILGGCVKESGDYSIGAGLVIMPHVLGSNAVYEAPTKYNAIIKNAKNVVFWGTDPLITNQISSSAPTHDGYLGLSKLKNSDIKTFSINVAKNNTSNYFNSQNIIIRPNTDTAMILAMCHYMIENEIYDKSFIEKYTFGFDKFKDYLLGINDGIAKDIFWAGKICDIAPETIAKFTKTLAQKPTTIIVGRAIQRVDHGEQAFWAIVALSCMLGYVGKEGLGFEFNLSYSSNGATRKIAPTLKGLSTKIYNSQDIMIPSSRFIEALKNPGKTIEHNGKKITLPHIRVAYIASSSIFTHHQDINNIIKQWSKLDSVITADPYWTSSAKLSDIVLPVAIEIERDDIIQTNSTCEYIIAYKPILAPAGESKSDFWICHEICKRWGKGEIFSEGKDEIGWMRKLYGDAREQAKAMDISMPEFDEFYKNGFVRFQKDDDKDELYTRLADFRQDPDKNRLATPSGKIELYSPTIEKMNYDDCPPHPAWIEPFEWLGNEKLIKKYPIHVVSPHSKYRLHSQLDNSDLRNCSKVSDKEPILLNPKNAKERNLRNGDIVRVFNDRGEILAGVLISNSVGQNVAIICEGAWYDPEIWGKKSLCQHGCINVLTRDKGTSKLSQSNSTHTCLVQIEKFNGEVRPIRAFLKPKILKNL